MTWTGTEVEKKDGTCCGALYPIKKQCTEEGKKNPINIVYFPKESREGGAGEGENVADIHNTTNFWHGLQRHMSTAFFLGEVMILF